MGTCTSCAAERETSPTTKVILEDGKLLEVAGPTRVAQVLPRAAGSFVCDADDMEFDSYMRAVGAEEELRLGQLYFVLPLSMLKQRLHPEGMAALAVRASAALLEGGSGVTLGTPTGGGKGEEAGWRAASVGGFSVGAVVVERRRRKGNASGSGRNFSPRLGAIPE